MDKYKKIIPCIFIEQGNAVKWINDKEVLTEDVVGLAKGYYEKFIFVLYRKRRKIPDASPHKKGK